MQSRRAVVLGLVALSVRVMVGVVSSRCADEGFHLAASGKALPRGTLPRPLCPCPLALPYNQDNGPLQAPWPFDL
jgi:hypothetical protein